MSNKLSLESLECRTQFSAEQVATLLRVVSGQRAESRMVCPLVSEVVKSFLRWSRQNRAKRTTDRYADFLVDFSEYCGDSELWSDLTGERVSDWVCGHKRWSVTTQSNAVTAVLRAESWASKYGVLSSRPLHGMEKPKPLQRDSWVTPEEHEQILAATPDEAGRRLFIAAWETGARPQELAAFEARHVFQDPPRIELLINESKGRKRRRVIYLSERAATIIAGLCATCSGRLLTNSKGRAWTASAMDCRMKRLAPVIGRKVDMYEYRHGFAVRMLRAGTDSVVLAQLMGHTDTRMLSRVYGHLAHQPELLSAAVN